MGAQTRHSRRFLTTVALIAALPLLCSADEKRLVPLKTTLPKPAFVGTPQHVVSPNLGKTSGKLRDPYRVPAGSANLALGKPVTGSERRPFIGTYALVVDGSKEADGTSFVELGPGRQWLQIDLGKPSKIFAILLWHYHGEARVYHDVVVQLGNAPEMTHDLITVFNNDHDNSSGLGIGKDKEYIETFEGRLIPVDGVSARYVRLYSRGNTTDDMNSMTEIEVHGIPAE